MKTVPLLVCALIVASAAAALAQGTSRSDHVVLVSVDGFRPDFYRDANWPAPTIQQMAREGVQARGVRGVFPTFTYPSHTTLVTGALPARHGIYYNSPFEPAGQTGRWYWEESAIEVPTLWDAVTASGRASASILWPVTVGALIEYNIPEFWSLEGGYGGVEPLRRHDVPDGLLEELEREATGALSTDRVSADYITRDTISAMQASYLLETYKPALLTVHLLGVDHFQHDDGRDSPRVRQALAAIDTAIREMVSGARRAGILERTAFVITGDHGFVDIHSTLAPNVWLVEAGLMDAAKDRGDWRAAFHTNGGSAFLHLRDPGDAATLRRVREIIDNLPHAQRRWFRVVERAELDLIGADPNVPFALAMAPGVRTSSSGRGEVLRSGRGGTHGFFPDFADIQTGFVAWGAGIRSGVVIEQLNLEDVAPTIATLLGLDFVAPDGSLHPGILER